MIDSHKKNIIEQLKNNKLEIPLVTNIDLSGEDLSGLQLKEVMFDDVKFDGTNLSNTTFESCLFSGCSFNQSKLNGACFNKSFFQRGFIAEETESEFDIALDFVGLPEEQKSAMKSAGITGFSYRKMHFFQANMHGVSFNTSQLEYVCFEECDLTNAKFDQLELKNVNFEKTNISAAIALMLRNSGLSHSFLSSSDSVSSR